MRLSIACWISAFAIAFASQNSASATLSYREQFSTDNANWSRDNNNTIPTVWAPNGGPDGSSHAYIDFSAFMQPSGSDHILFQARDENNSSGNNFVGNWFADGINQFSMWVRHNASAPVPFFARFTNAAGTTGVAAFLFAPVLSNTWTQISFDLDPSNINHPVNNPMGQLFAETSPMNAMSLYNSTFTDVRHIQVGIRLPTGFGAINSSFRYQLDSPAIAAVPEPASFAIAGMASIFGLFGRRRRAASY